MNCFLSRGNFVIVQKSTLSLFIGDNFGYGIEKKFVCRTCVGVCVHVCDKLYVSKHCIEFNLAILIFFAVFWGLIAWKKCGPFYHFGPFWAIFPNFGTLIFLFFKYLILSEILVIICSCKLKSRRLIRPTFVNVISYIYMKWRYGIFIFFLIFLNFLSPTVFDFI